MSSHIGENPDHRFDDSDHVCITCGKADGACRWIDDPIICMRRQLTALRAENERLKTEAAE